MPYHSPGKCANQSPSFTVSSNLISDFVVSPFDDLLAVGDEKGKVSVLRLPNQIDSNELNPNFPPLHHFSHSSDGRPIDKLTFNPTTSSLLSTSSASNLSIWDLNHSSSIQSPVINLDHHQLGIWDLQWNWNGDLIGCTTKDGNLSIWDPRNGNRLIGSCLSHGVAGKKCSRLAWINNYIITTGVNKLREREISLYDPRELSKGPLKSQTIDNSTGVLIPLIDPNRSMVYLSGRGETSVRWFEINSTSINSNPIEVHQTRLVDPIAGIAMAPINPSTVDVMKAEICKLVILSKNQQVLPVIIQAPKRQYLDFHLDVMPPVRSMTAAQTSTEWLNGGNATIEMVSQDPADSGTRSSITKSTDIPLTTITSKAQPTQPEPLPVASKSKPFQQPTSQVSSSDQPVSLPTQPKASQAKDLVPPISSLNISEQTAKSSVPKARWSRKYLTGKTPMKADYEDLQNLSSTFSSDREMIKSTPRYCYVPLGGAGGKLGVIEVQKKGRLPTHLPAFLSQTDLVSFEVDLLVEGRVFVGGLDGKVRVFQVPEDGLKSDIEEVQMMLSDPKIDRIHIIKAHPIAKDIIFVISEDQGEPTLRIWDVSSSESSSEPIMKFKIPCQRVSSANWSNGSMIAICDKDSGLYVIDPRKSQRDGKEEWCVGKTHDACQKSNQLSWIDSQKYLLTTGFNSLSMRELKVYRVEFEKKLVLEINRISFETVSLSPSFVFFDQDLSVIFCWSKGERSLNLIEVIINEETEEEATEEIKLEKLMGFSHSSLQLGFSFFPKQIMNVKEIEVDRALRLTQNSIEVVSFMVPRNRTEFFQDDIFIDTLDVLEATFWNAKEWIEGKEKEEKEGREGKMVGLKPEGMKCVSEMKMESVGKSKQRELM
ncbi:uncharacterized protein MELLADRAFT_92887 [Melampsora larici-populina 98AG31]|uniref:DUF1899 domain-containing protein n=1 Tax=Melampsora larici-populina (strain 98AG31 / pathotype 3-4-7) TaxID=747676 RepID=F4S349_MELLP|nr:uncharacterized protein MELLADRAFT_92887 [Melampsora larici-populina 98AG31]EGG00921.1 hypothetical protein MELLADRAFT_92887 [Melampsora larici-populina 98AG31]